MHKIFGLAFDTNKYSGTMLTNYLIISVFLCFKNIFSKKCIELYTFVGKL